MLRRPFKPLHHGGSPESAVELLSLAMEGWRLSRAGTGWRYTGRAFTHPRTPPSSLLPSHRPYCSTTISMFAMPFSSTSD